MNDMTGDEFPKSLSGRIIETAKVIGAMSIIFSACVGVWAWTVGPVAEFFSRIDQLVEDMEEVKQDVARANGEDRVIRQPEGMSYIKEPVRQGQPVTMIAVVGRTKLGEGCILTDWVPIFSDERNIPTPGRPDRAGPPRRQIDGDLTPLEIVMRAPPSLRPGRATVYLTLTYRCQPSQIVVRDRTRTLPFELLPEEPEE